MFYSYFERISTCQRCVLAFQDHVKVTYLWLEGISCNNTHFYNKAIKCWFDYVLCIGNRRTRNIENIKNEINCKLTSLQPVFPSLMQHQSISVQVCKVNKHYVFQIHKTPKAQCYLKTMPSILKMSATDRKPNSYKN